jgi:2-dehydro-3-deoxyphosphogalactonate aldolase
MTHKTAPWPDLKHDLVAILRGVKPDEILPIAFALAEEGFEAIEVPLNSPDPLRSIETLAKSIPHVIAGAGTVLTADNVRGLADAGGRLLVSPNIDAAVMEEAARHKLVTMPGVFTATEALLAIRLGASALKFFPASALGAGGINGIRAILPRDCIIGAVGGVADADFAAYRQVGVRAFGLGSSLYKPGFGENEVRKRARAAVTAYRALPPLDR